MAASARWFALAACVIALLGLGQLAAVHATTRPQGIRAAQADPVAFDGQGLMMLLWQVTATNDAGFEVAHEGHRVQVISAAPAPPPGSQVTVEGRFRARDGAVLAERVTVHRWRRAKQLIGLAGTILAVLVLPLGFRVEGGELVERG